MYRRSPVSGLCGILLALAAAAAAPGGPSNIERLRPPSGGAVDLSTPSNLRFSDSAARERVERRQVARSRPPRPSFTPRVVDDCIHAPVVTRFPVYGGPFHYYPWAGLHYPRTPYFWWSNGGLCYVMHPYRDYGYGWDGYGPVIGMPVRLPLEPPVEAEPVPPPEPDPLLQARLLLLSRDYQGAVTLLRRLEQWRLLGVALVGAARMPEAVAAFVKAYEEDPRLFDRPLDGEDIVSGAMELRQLVGEAVRYAQKVETAEAWFAVAVLMQAQGRLQLAREMVDRAQRAEAAGRGTLPRPPAEQAAAAVPQPEPAAESDTLPAKLGAGSENQPEEEVAEPKVATGGVVR